MLQLTINSNMIRKCSVEDPLSYCSAEGSIFCIFLIILLLFLELIDLFLYQLKLNPQTLLESPRRDGISLCSLPNNFVAGFEKYIIVIEPLESLFFLIKNLNQLSRQDEPAMAPQKGCLNLLATTYSWSSIPQGGVEISLELRCSKVTFSPASRRKYLLILISLDGTFMSLPQQNFYIYQG